VNNLPEVIVQRCPCTKLIIGRVPGIEGINGRLSFLNSNFRETAIHSFPFLSDFFCVTYIVDVLNVVWDYVTSLNIPDLADKLPQPADVAVRVIPVIQYLVLHCVSKKGVSHLWQ